MAEIMIASDASRPITSSICCLTRSGLGRGQIDLVEDRHDFEIIVERLIDVRERLGFDALRGVHHQKRAFARGEAAADFVGEIDVAGRVDQVEDVGLPRPWPCNRGARSGP